MKIIITIESSLSGVDPERITIDLDTLAPVNKLSTEVSAEKIKENRGELRRVLVLIFAKLAPVLVPAIGAVVSSIEY